MKNIIKKVLIVFLVAILVFAMLTACGKTDSVENDSAQNTPEENSEKQGQEDNEEERSDSSESEENASAVASAEDMTEVEEVVEEGMVPVYADSLIDGTYPVEMKSSSSMFKADHVELKVAEGKMEAVLYMTSEAYPYMFKGSAEEAAQADESEFILPDEIDGDMRTFTLPIEALDDGESFAAFSRRRELWYDRTLLFRADSLPEEAFGGDFFVTPSSLALQDGTYTVDVNMSGGSGRASVETPTTFTVEGETVMVNIKWGSPNYDYMIVNGEKYEPINEEGNSEFLIPLTVFNRSVRVLADTTAMSEAHEIEYMLTYYSESVKPAE